MGISDRSPLVALSYKLRLKLTEDLHSNQLGTFTVLPMT